MQSKMCNYDELKATMKKRISELSDNNVCQICIFGAGKRGMKLLKELNARFINVDFLADNNSEKVGMKIEQVKIISFDELKVNKNNVIVIISAADYKDIEQQFICEKFPYVYVMNNIQKLYSDIPPLKWLEEFDESIDFNSKETMKLINLFQKIILDICEYYEK